MFTHDSIGLGEDGPTHQPIEHASSLRLTPNVSVWRPCDIVETAEAWKYAIERMDGPSCLLLTRQNIPQQTRDAKTLRAVQQGGYILENCKGMPDAIIIATGSEVSIARLAMEHLTNQGLKIRLVSMPCTSVFDEQDPSYQEEVLPKRVKARVAVEAGSTDFWYKYVGMEGKVIGLNCYGESAPCQDVYNALGITVEAIEKAVKSVL